MLRLLRTYQYICLLIVEFVAIVLLIGFKGNFPTNDDWIYYRQVEAFTQDNFSLHAKLLATFITQGFLAVVWSKLFGLSFVSLRILSLLCTFLTVVMVYLTALMQTRKRFTAYLISNMYLLNPIVLTSMFTFMTEPYSMLFISLALFFIIKYQQNNLRLNFWVSLFLSVLSFFTRQTNIFLFLLLGGIVMFSNQHYKQKAFFVSAVSFVALIVVVLSSLWPRYHYAGFDYTADAKSLSSLAKVLSPYVLGLPVVVYFLSPLLLGPVYFLRHVSKLAKLGLVAAGLVATRLIFLYDLFPLGSVFYIESLHAKSGYKFNLSVTDNIFVKLILSLLISYTLLMFFLYLLEFVKKTYKEKIYAKPRFWLLLGGVLSTLPFVVTPAVFDRYLLVPFYCLLLFFSTNATNKKFTYIVFGILTFFSLCLTYEYHRVRQLKWQIMDQLYLEYNVPAKKVLLDDTVSKYLYAREINDYTGLQESLPQGLTFECYIQQYTQDTPFSLFIGKAHAKVTRYINIPSIYQVKKPVIDVSIKEHLDVLVVREMYFSPLYSIIGKNSFVGSWCPKLTFVHAN